MEYEWDLIGVLLGLMRFYWEYNGIWMVYNGKLLDILSANQTWQWKITRLYIYMVHCCFPIYIYICRWFPIAMFGYRTVTTMSHQGLEDSIYIIYIYVFFKKKHNYHINSILIHIILTVVLLDTVGKCPSNPAVGWSYRSRRMILKSCRSFGNMVALYDIY